MGLAAIYSSIGHAHMVILTFWAFYLQHQFTVYCVILCFSLLSSRMVVCEVLIELHHSNHQMNSVLYLVWSCDSSLMQAVVRTVQ